MLKSQAAGTELLRLDRVGTSVDSIDLEIALKVVL